MRRIFVFFFWDFPAFPSVTRNFYVGEGERLAKWQALNAAGRAFIAEVRTPLSLSTSIFFVSSPAVGFSTNDQIQQSYGHANKPELPDPLIFLSFKLSHPNSHPLSAPATKISKL
jgi:hypothetical protein